MKIYLLWALAISSTASATTLALHEGSNDPTTEGWAAGSCCGATGPNGPLANDLGLAAWSMAVPAGDGQFFYTDGLSVAERDAALTTGWRMTMIARVVQFGTAPIDQDYGIGMFFSHRKPTV